MRAFLSALMQFLRAVTATRTGQIALGVCLLCALLALFAPWLAPFDPSQKHYDDAGKLLRIADPSFKHWLGTTSLGRDVLSQMIWGARPAMLVGLVVALGSAIIGANIGLLAGYYGGRFDNLLMRFTDIVMGVPFLPFVIVMLSVSGKSLSSLILAMTLIMWRASARIVRAQVMSLKQMPFVAAARITGASDLAILYREIAPNIVPLALVNMAFALAWAITTEASIGFLGFGDPDVISWGSIIYDAFASQAMYRAPWWVAPPGVAIMVLVSAVYLVGREYERVANPRLAGP
jgi:peptide/nickel transport system permease protein